MTNMIKAAKYFIVEFHYNDGDIGVHTLIDRNEIPEILALFNGDDEFETENSQLTQIIITPIK